MGGKENVKQGEQEKEREGKVETEIKNMTLLDSILQK